MQLTSSTWPESDFADEFDLLLDMYDGQVTRSGERELRVALPYSFALRITVPARGYPRHRHPDVSIVDGPNAVLVSELERTLVARVLDEVPLDSPMASLMIHIAIECAEAIEADVALEQAHKLQRRADEEDALERCDVMRVASGIHILAGDAITDRKSKFLAHIASVTCMRDVLAVIEELRSLRWIACAAHPTIYAYRFRDAQNVLHQDAEDDGETGAAKKVLFLMDSLGVMGYIVVVTRWFGGILLGPDRFKHIMQCAKSALIMHGVVPG